MSVEQKAREILNAHCEYSGGMDRGQVFIRTDNAVKAVEIGIIEGLEMAAKVAENAASRRFTKDMREMCELIAKQIRALIEEQKL